jgi:Zn-dependent metalloprotease
MKKLLFQILCIFLLIGFVKSNAQFQHFALRNNARYNEKTGFISAIYNADFNAEGVTPEEVVKNYLSNNYKSFGMKKDISDLTITSIRENLGTKHIVFKQFYEGIEVINANIVVSLNREDKISMIVSNYHPISKLEIRPIVNKYEAETKAKNLFAASGNDIITKSDLKIFVDENGKEHLAWRVSTELTIGLPIGLVFIDATNGEVLRKDSFGQKYVNGTGRVFDPDPGTYLRNANLSDTSNVSSAYKQVTLENLNGNGYV